MKLVTFSNIKGGVSKTTTTILVAYELSKKGKKVLIIDADLQSNCTQMLYKIYHEDKTILDAIVDNVSLDKLIIKEPNKDYENIDLVPADISLFTASEHIAVRRGSRERVIAKYLKSNIDIVNKYDYVFVDLAPSIDILARNFLYVADSIVIPITHGDLSALRGASLFLDVLEEELEDLGIEDNIKKVAFISKHINAKREMLDLFNKFLDSGTYNSIRDIMLSSYIDNSTTVEKAVVTKKSVKDLKNRKISDQMDSFIKELEIKEVL